jgi:hypothetical protein
MAEERPATSGNACRFTDVLLPMALWIEKESIYDYCERRHQLVQKEFAVHGTAKMGGYRHLTHYNRGMDAEPIRFLGTCDSHNGLPCHAGPAPLAQSWACARSEAKKSFAR